MLNFGKDARMVWFITALMSFISLGTFGSIIFGFLVGFTMTALTDIFVFLVPANPIDNEPIYNRYVFKGRVSNPNTFWKR